MIKFSYWKSRLQTFGNQTSQRSPYIAMTVTAMLTRTLLGFSCHKYITNSQNFGDEIDLFTIHSQMFPGFHTGFFSGGEEEIAYVTFDL